MDGTAVRWLGVVRRLKVAIAKGLGSLAPLSGVPWPDLPTQGWVIGHDGMPAPVPTAMDGGPALPTYRPTVEVRERGASLSPAERRAWVELRERLLADPDPR